jgi:hypothetical protein
VVTGSDHACLLAVTETAIEESGPLRSVIAVRGRAEHQGETVVELTLRVHFFAGSPTIKCAVMVRNPRRAAHPGGYWELGDAGSVYLKDVTLRLTPPRSAQPMSVVCSPETGAPFEAFAAPFTLYQDSSGGANWQSSNHVNRHGKVPLRYRGYRIEAGDAVRDGLRATPVVRVTSGEAGVSVAVPHFWQNFPKAIHVSDGMLALRLFPRDFGDVHEIQAGEQKTHTFFVGFGPDGVTPDCLDWCRTPTMARLPPQWYAECQPVPFFSPRADGQDEAYERLVSAAVDGESTFLAKREQIDEWGWRNFGEIYGDHEAVRAQGPSALVSHYNNQYDAIAGFAVQFFRSGDLRWWPLMQELAAHVVDIDIYHTTRDKAAYNGGLFWHTDHYLPARTATHRTHSRHNGPSGAYGGGPANEHNYTTGLLHYYYLTGDVEAADAVRELAEWVIGMDDGARTLFGLIDSGPTGFASKTLESTFHHPGRGAGNSVNALLDAYVLSRQRPYLAKAEEIIQRCIHPDDDIAALGLDDPEHRWSYLVFLQILGKYLAAKLEMRETDYAYHYALSSFVRYAAWVAENEVPYKDVLHKVELPTETWPAHDIRKSHVLYVAAGYSAGPQRERFLERAAFFFDRCMTDLLEFNTAYVTRPQVILCVYGSVFDYFARFGAGQPGDIEHNYDFGTPSAFVPQRARVGRALKLKLRVLAAELSRLFRNKLYLLRGRMRRSR